MRRDRPLGDLRLWARALLLSVVAGVAAYFWTGVGVTPKECSTGDAGGSSLSVVGLAALWLLAALATGWQAHRRRGSWELVVFAVLVSLGSGGVLIVLAASFWWSGHGCYT